MSNVLNLFKKHVPVEFVRKSRSLVECKRFKATEFRLFLLYTGPVVLQKVISLKQYQNVIALSVAISIMCSKTFTNNAMQVISYLRLSKIQ